MHDPLAGTRSRARIAQDNCAELATWIDERTEALVATGLTRDQARQRALEEFGDVDAAAQYGEVQDVALDRRVRVALWLEELSADLRIAARTLARTPTVTAVVLLTFALGIGATTAVFSVVHAMLIRALPYGREETLFYLPAVDDGVIRPGPGGARHSATAITALRERLSSFSGIAAVAMGNTILLGRGDPEQIWLADGTLNTFDVLQAHAAIGRTFATSEPNPNIVILLDGIWRWRFGADPNIVGRIVEFTGSRREVIGVMPAGFRVPTYEQAEIIVPRDLTDILRNPNSAQVRAFRLFGRVKSDVAPSVVQADLDRAMQSLRAEYPRPFAGVEARAIPIRAAVAGGARPRLLVLMAAAVFVLLIACANIAGILLARAIARRDELAVRMALGAGRGRLVRQFVTEGGAVAIVGGALGLGVAQAGIVLLRKVASSALPAETTFALGPSVVAFAMSVAVVAALAASLVPAIGATRSVGIALRRDDARASASRANRRLRLALVAGQLAVSVVLLVGAGLLVRTLQQLAALDLGYDVDHMLTFRPRFTRPMTNAEQDAYYASLYAEVRAIPGVVSVAGGNTPTSGDGTVTRLMVERREAEQAHLPDVRYTPTSDDYFKTLGIPIVRGRVFDANDRDGVPWVAVISEGLAKQLWPGGNPIGVRIKPAPDKEWATIVGVVGDVRVGGADAAQPSIYTSQRQDHWPSAGPVVVRASGDAASLANSVREAVKRVDASLVMTGLRTLEDVRRSTPAIADRRLQMQLIATFALAALLVSAIGVYGVSAYAIEARAREFGIRIALGASGRGVLWLALGDAVRVGAIGFAIGVPVAWILTRRVRDLLFAVAPFDPPTVAVAAGALVFIVLASSLLPARRAARIDPARAMRD